jgi:hypothetical protein
MKPEQQKAFDKFWKECWPKCRRKEKKKAADQWAKIASDMYGVIYSAVERQKKQPSWKKEDCSFIPYPHRWLRGQRWEDEIALPEDADAEALMEALASHAAAPHDFPRHIMARLRKMCERTKTNWPRIHFQIANDEAMAQKIKSDYLATEG